jgi:hypothetical protein
MEMATGIHQMKPHGGKIGAPAVLLNGIIRREKTSTEDDDVKRNKDYEPSL